MFDQLNRPFYFIRNECSNDRLFLQPCYLVHGLFYIEFFQFRITLKLYYILKEKGQCIK